MPALQGRHQPAGDALRELHEEVTAAAKVAVIVGYETPNQKVMHMGDKSPKSKDKNKKQSTASKNKKQAVANAKQPQAKK